MAAANIFKNRKITITTQWTDGFWQNLAQWSIFGSL